MSRRTQVVAASALTVVGVVLVSSNYLGLGPLNAAAVGGTQFDYTKLFLWSGIVLLVVSALLYIRASAE